MYVYIYIVISYTRCTPGSCRRQIYTHTYVCIYIRSNILACIFLFFLFEKEICIIPIFLCVFVCVWNTFIFTHMNKCRESYTERSTQRKACLPSALGAPSPHSHLLVYCFFTAALLLFRARRTISYLMLTGVLSSTTRPHWLSSHFFVCM
jgi:hypothetical protein